ncbi:MAG: hypothetical protein JNL19_15105 [Burkholderiales bacterium]|nr:hypothetical protein [Burkholderiales bacterium]
MARQLLRFLIRMLQLPLALLVMFYEWGWDTLSHVFDWLARRPIWSRLENAVRRLPPWAALGVFLLPTALLFPVKLLALWFIANGQKVLGVALILLAKIVGTAIVARLFTLTHNALMQIGWFARLYRWFVPWKDLWMDAIRASWPWRIGRVIKRSVKRRAAAMFQRVFRRGA